MSTLRRKRAPPAFVRWLQLLFATVFAKKHAPSWTTLARRSRRRADRPHAGRRGRHLNDFAPTLVMKRIENVVDERWMHAGAGVDVSEEDLETLPAELREAFLGHRHRTRRREDNVTAA